MLPPPPSLSPPTVGPDAGWRRRGIACEAERGKLFSPFAFFLRKPSMLKKKGGVLACGLFQRGRTGSVNVCEELKSVVTHLRMGTS